jgi:hypothetical protein
MYSRYMSKLSVILNNPTNIKILSFVWGLGVAIILMNRCMDGHCVVIEGPAKKDIENKVFQVGEACFKFKPTVAECKKENIPLSEK